MNTSTQSNTGSLFGTKQSTPTFPSLGATNTAPTSGLFQQQKPAFGQLNSAAPSTFNFGSPSAPAASSFSFGNSKPTFGTPTNTTAFGAPSTNITAFGAPSTNTPVFGTSLNTPAFGSQTNTSIFNTTNNVPNSISEEDLFIESISQPSLCGDERDGIISRWNQLQAMWGSGCGLSSKGKSIYKEDNYLARFKSISYNEVPRCEDSDGLVSLLIRRSHSQLCGDMATQFHERLHQLINNNAISISIVDIRPAIKAFNTINNNNNNNQPKISLGFSQTSVVTQTVAVANGSNSDSLCDVIIKVTETMANGPPRIVHSSMLANFLKTEPLKSKLESELLVIDVVPQLSPNSKEINDYLSGPAPRGLDVEFWEKAKQQCPNASTMVPVPVIGMSELKARISGQVEFSQSQLSTIKKEVEIASELKTKVVTMLGKIDQLKRKQTELSSRILRVMCKLEIVKKQGYSLSAEEETLKCSLDKLCIQMLGPYGIKSRLQEILSSGNTAGGYHSGTKGLSSRMISYNSLNNESMEELKEYFSERQQSIKEMMALLREDIACVNVIENLY